MASQRRGNPLLVRDGFFLLWVWIHGIVVMEFDISSLGIVTYGEGDFSTEAAAPPAEGPGPGDETAADFCHTDTEVTGNKELLYNTQSHLKRWINLDSCNFKVNDSILFEDVVRDVFSQFLDNGLWYEPGDDEGTGKDFSQQHGTVSKLVVIGKFLSKLLHNFQCHFLRPVKLGHHLLEFLRRLPSPPFLRLAEQS